MAAKIKQGDKVVVTKGSHRNSEGTVIRVNISSTSVTALVSGVNIKQTFNKRKKQRVAIEFPIHVSNLKLIDDSTGLGSRVGFRMSQEGKKERFCKVSGKRCE